MNSELDCLAGLKVTSVCFVVDYVELWFDRPVLRIFTRPFLCSGGVRLGLGDSGARDLLCGLIGAMVLAVELKDDLIKLDFEGEVRLEISLTPDAYSGPEAAHFIPYEGGPMSIW